MSASEEKLLSRISVFPEGVLVAEHDGVVVGAVSFIQLADYRLEDELSWEELSDDGWCENHTPNGKVLFGVDLSVSRRAPRSTAALIFMSGMELGMRLGVDRVVWGGRMPRYHKHAADYSPDEYLRARTKRGRYLDPEVELYSKIPGVEILGVVPDYFKDWESLNNGVMLSWKNPIRRMAPLRFLRRYVRAYLYRPGRRSRRSEPLPK